MKKLLLPIIATIMLFVATPSAQALEVGVEGGATYLDYSGMLKDFEYGYYLGGRVSYNFIPMIGIVGKYNYTQVETHDLSFEGLIGQSTQTKGMMSGNAFELMLKVEPPIPFINIYAAVGGGYYLNKVTFGDESFNQDGFGLVADVGIGYSILILDFMLNGTYRNQSLSGGGYSSSGNRYTLGLLVNIDIPFI